MPAKRISEDKARRIYELSSQGLSTREIGEQLGIAHTTVHKYLQEERVAGHSPPCRERPDEELNAPIDDRGPAGGETRILTPDRPRTLEEMYELFAIDRKLWQPVGLRSNEWQGFYKLKDGSGHRKVALWQTRVSWRRVVTEPLERAILEFARTYVKAIPKPRLREVRPYAEPQLVSWGLWDAHLGMHAWHTEVGEDYDLKIATRRVFNSIDDMSVELERYPIQKILMPVGNDFMHFDSVRQKTTYGEHFLDTDSRYGKVYMEGLRCLSYMVERALEVAKEVELIYVPGNHDLTASYTLCVALAQRFRKDPRVSVDLSFNPRKYRRHGGTLLGFEHGQKCKPQQLALIFAQEAKEDWSGSTYREIQTGHTHQRRERMFESLTPNNGVLVRTNPALCSVDRWHHDQGFIGEPMKSVEAWRYDKVGYRGSHVAWARDEETEASESYRL